MVFANEPSGLENEWIRLAGLDLRAPKVWMNAYLAAFAISGGFELVTIDTAFLQFKGLSLQLIGAG